jgi:GGDEF domain-containing protein
MPTPPLSIDDLFAADTAKPKPRAPAAPATPAGPIDLDALWDNAPAPAADSTATPAPRRGIGNAIADSFGSLRDPFGLGARTEQVGNQLFPSLRGERRRMVPPTDRRTSAQRVAEERAAAAQQYGRVPAEATATPAQQVAPGPGGMVLPATEAASRETAHKLAERAAHRSSSLPRSGDRSLNRGDGVREPAPRPGPKHDEAEDVLRKAYNAQLLSEGAKEADTHGAIVLSNLLGIIKDPYAGQRRNVAEAMQPGMVATPEEQQTMGIAKPTAPDRPFSASKDIVAPLVGAAPMIVGTGLAGRGLAALGAGVAERYGFETAAKAFTSLAQPSEITALAGPKVPVTSAANLATRIGEEVQEFRAALPSMLKRGATEGQLAMGAQQYRMARQQGATVEQALGAAIQGAELNIPMGAAAEVGLGIAGRAAGVGYDPIGHLASRIRDRVRGTEVVGPEALDAADAARSADGQLPITDQTSEAAHRKIAGALEDLLNQRKTAQDAETRRLSSRFEDVQSAFEEQPPPAGRDWWEANAPGGDRMVEPVEGYRAREENPPLRTAAEIASERARPTDEANAMVRMQREEEFGRAARMEAEQAAQDPNLRLEQAAQQRPEEVQGPRTLGETLADAQEQRDQGEPLASDYHDAINKYVDALAQVRDLPEDQTPTMRQQVALARAKQALNDARKRYGRQLGASAVLALALNDDELSDDEKKFGGLAAVGLLGVPEGEREPIKAEPGVFSSRLRTAIEALGKDREGKGGKAWDTPRPAADWIGKLKNSNEFSKNELKLIMPELEGAQREKLKLSRADVLRIAEDKLPRIEPTTLADAPVPERATATREPGALPEGDADDITDIDDVNPDDREEVMQQLANRQARVDEIERSISSQQEEAERTMNDADDEAAGYASSIRSELRDANLDEGLADPAIDYLNEHVESDYIPRGAVEKAMDEIADDLQGAMRPGMDEDQLRQELEDRGYTVEEVEHYRNGERTQEKVGVIVPEGHPMRARVSGIPAGERPDEFVHRFSLHTREQSLAEIRRRYGDEAAASARFFEEPVEPEMRWEVRDEDGKMVPNGYGDTEEIAMRDAADHLDIDHRGTEDDFNQLYSTIKDRLNDYAYARAAYSEAESMYYHYTENEEDAFSDENAERERLGEQMETLREHLGALNEAAAARAARQAEINAQQTTLPLDAPPPPPPQRDPFLEAVPITPKGKTEFSTYQRIGGGTDYSELVFRWDNRPEGDIPTDAYGGHDYWSSAGVQSAIGHVRREMHVVYDTPDVSGSEIRYEPGEPENIRLLKSRIEEVRKKRDTALDQMNALAAEFTALPETDRQSSRATEIANKYRDLNNDVKNFGTREDELAAEIRDHRGLGDKEGKPVNVMIENQASLAQHQSHLGPPPDPAEVARLRREYENANEAYERAVTASNDAESAAKGVSQEYEAIADRAFDVYGAVDNALRDEYERATGRSYLPSGWQIQESSWEPTFRWLEEHGGDEMRTVIGRLREARQQQAILEKATDEAETVMRTARRDWRDAEGDGSDLRVDTPFNDTQAAIQLNAAGFLLDAANRGSERVAWSDGANRVRNAHQQISAARYVYDQATPAAMRRLLGYLGFKDVKPEKIWIKGNGHWMIELTPDMRRAIRKYGLPALGVMALVGSPSEAKAQDTASDSSTRSLYSGVVGGIVAGAALAALMASKKLRRLVKENRELNRALMIDDLSGLANKRAFARARESVDTDPATSWVALDASQFKRVNDTAGHDAGDQAIAHFGRAIVAAAKDAGVPMRGFRSGGDEFAFAVPKGREAEFIDAVEQTSKRSFGGVDTQLHGAAGDTFTEADARLMTRKRDLGVSRGGYEQSDLFKTARRAEQTLVSNAISDAEIGDIVDRLKKGQAPATGEEAEIVARAIAEAQLPKDLPQGVVLHANPIGPAMRQLARYPSSAALIGLGALLGESDNDNVRRAGVPTMVLGALSVIGSHRLSMGAEALGDGIIKTLGTTQAGRRAIEFLNPSILLSREAKQALEKYREGLSYGRAVALEHSRAAERLGPEGNRAVSDVIENEGWEDVSKFTPQQMSDVLTVAAGIESEVRKLTDAKITHGVLRPEQAIPNYLKREYAHFDVLDALADHQGYGQAAGKTMGAATKSRVLDEPIHAAEAALADAQQSGDAQKIKAAQDALTEANLVQQQNRTTLGEIREASYRVGKSFDQGWHDVAAAKLHETLRNVPGTIHPDYARALDDFLAARDLAKQATTTADRDAARALVDRAYIEMREIGDRYKAKDGDWRTLPESRSYGVLRGMPVTRAIHAELTPAFDPNSWDDFVQFWKQAKTIFNVGTSVANVASNVMFSHMEGLPIYQQPKYLRAALKDLKAYGPATRVLAERGVLEASATFSPNEIKNPAAMRSEEGLSDLFATTRPETRAVMEQRGLTAERIQRNKRVGTIGRTVAGAAMGMALTADEDNPEDAAIGAVGGLALGAVLTPKVRNLIRRGYANEDNLFRLALYLKKLDDGIPSDYAAKYAKQSLGDMSAPQSPATQWIRRTASPFFLYPLRAVPRFAQQAIDHPWRYVALMGAMAAVDLYSRSQVGDVPERDLAPADRRDMFGYFLPGFTQLPLTDEQGNKGGVDLARWTPLSALTSSAPPGATGGALSDEFPAVFQPSGPLLDLGGRLAANVDPFSGKPLIKKDYPLGENISNVLNQAGEMAAPSMLAFHRRRLEDDVRNRDWTKFKNDILGPTGMRPRYVRPGGEVRQATFQLGEDLNAMKHEFSQAMIANKNPDRSAQIVDQYLRRVTSALSHFSERIGPPPKELVNQALDVRTP